MAKYKCYKCQYEWETIVEKPKSCPRCKTRLDYVFKETVNHQKEEEVHIQDEEKEPVNLRKKYGDD